MKCFDAPGENLNADIPEDKFILINIEDKFVDIMCEVSPEHKKNMCVGNGVKVLYLRLLKFIYGCMESALLRYDLFSNNTESHSLLVNPSFFCFFFWSGLQGPKAYS